MAKPRTRTARTTVSVPTELRRRMQEVTEPVNWSAVAAEAFQAKLAAIAAQKKEKVMSDVVERLRASKRQGETADYQDGYALGKQWAEQSAEASELQRLEELHDRLDSQPQCDWDDYFSSVGSSAYGTDETLFFAIQPEADGDRSAARDFWQYVAGDAFEHTANPVAFLKGFAEGAIDLWRAVQKDL